MKRKLSILVLLVMFCATSWAMHGMNGTLGACVGYTSALTDSTTGGTWSSSDPSIASVDVTTGIVTGVAVGTATITYTVGSSYVTAAFTVALPPAPITGATIVCVRGTDTLYDATPGGTWTGTPPGIAYVYSTGVVAGASAGIETVSYYVTPGCVVTTTVTVDALTAGIIRGDSIVCLGTTAALTDTVTGGVWSSSDVTIATVSTSGVVTGIADGFASISYVVTGACGSSITAHYVHVESTTYAGTIYGGLTAPVGGTTTLSPSVGGGVWSSSDITVATVSAGVVTGVSAGVATISYALSGCGGTVYATATVTVSVINRISGTVELIHGSMDSTGVVKVWLITYNPSDSLLEAIDSVTISSPGAFDYYEFLGESTDSYRVKAAFFPSTFSSTGYIPTYHDTSYYWSMASVFVHNSGRVNDGINITMGYGTVTSGPGFIAGNVYTGANRGSGTSAPSAGLLVYALTSTGTLLQQTYTNGSGHYSFSNLPLGTYTIYPELINYRTIAYTGVTLTTAESSVVASFNQHTVSRTITPVPASVSAATSQAVAVTVFPNPVDGKLNIQWNENATEKGTITVTDVEGRVVYTSSVNMTEGAGSCQVNLSGLTNGIYFMSIQSASINYNNKIELQH